MEAETKPNAPKSRPSRGCHVCRRRKVRCDRTPGGCRNCAKFRYECPGYPEDSGLVFRSENQTAALKVEKRIAKKRESSQRAASESQRSASSEAATPSLAKSTRKDSFSASYLVPDLDSHALSYFLANFMMSGSLEPTSPVEAHSCREYHLMREGLEMGMKAVALASMATFTKSPKLSVEARKRYLSAVANTNEALKSPVVAKDDMLLATVLILNSFEVVGGPNEQSLVDWSNHAYGAAALVKLRGPQQFESPNGITLFHAAISLVLAASMREDRPLLDNILELTEEATLHRNNNDSMWQFFVLKVRFVYFYTQHIQVWPFLKDTIDPGVAISKALELDAAIAPLFEDVEGFHGSYTIYLPQMEEFSWDGHCQVFQHFVSSAMHNDLRIHRIVLNALVRNLLETTTGEHTSFFDRHGREHIVHPGKSSTPILTDAEERKAQIQRSMEIQTQMQAEILSTVPQHLGLVNYEDGAQTKKEDPLFNFPWKSFERWHFQPREPGTWVRTVPVIRSYGGYALQWGLFVAGKVKHTSPGLRLKIIRLLRMLGLPMGNQQAAVFAERTEIEDSNF